MYEYPLLYTNRHNQQVIHSIDHVAQTVQNYGQLSNYSTYNFESVLGNELVNRFSIAFCLSIADMLRATVHSTKHHAIEIANTMNLLRLAIRNSQADDFINELKIFLEQVQKKKRIILVKLSKKQNENPDIKLQKTHKIVENQYNGIKENRIAVNTILISLVDYKYTLKRSRNNLSVAQSCTLSFIHCYASS